MQILHREEKKTSLAEQPEESILRREAFIILEISISLPPSFSSMLLGRRSHYSNGSHVDLLTSSFKTGNRNACNTQRT